MRGSIGRGDLGVGRELHLEGEIIVLVNGTGTGGGGMRVRGDDVLFVLLLTL